MSYNHCEKELPNEYERLNLENAMCIFDWKDATIEIVRKDGNLRRWTRLENVSDSMRRFLMRSTGMGLTFEHTRVIGARFSENSLLNGEANQNLKS